MKTEPVASRRLPSRRHFLRRGLLLGSLASLAPSGLHPLLAVGGGFKFQPDAPLIPAPEDPQQWDGFRRQLANWREQKRRELDYSDALYQREDFRWVPAGFACGFLMLCDESFYDPRAGRYRVREFAREARREFGGFDSVVLWHAYPRIGFDDRNQFDFYRDAPGGLKGLRAVVKQLRREGIRAFIDYNPWDTGTRREPKADLDALAEMVAALDADGIFLDTMDRGAEAFRARLDAARPGVVLEGEIALPLERVHDHQMSWAQWFEDGLVPGVLRNKWFERRHLQHQIKRWDRDHTGELHCAWMNGSGMMVWENVFGSFNGWSGRDRSLLRLMLPIQRRFVDLFAGESWTPLVPTLQEGVYASLWEGRGVRLWTLVNRSAEPRDGPLLAIEWREGERLFDLVSGREVFPRLNSTPPAGARGSLPPRGIGCFVAAVPQALGHGFHAFLAQQRQLAAQANWDTSSPSRHASLTPARRTPLDRTPADMACIPATTVRMKTEFRVRECGFYDATHPHFAQRFPALHGLLAIERDVRLGAYGIELTPVTNADFARFLKAAGYRPKHGRNFLKHWIGGAPPPGREDHPVVYVDLADARAYARWRGRRLPTEEEWQFAAQGAEARRYPWGDALMPGCCNDGRSGGTTPVRAFPAGRSPFGLYDLCGNVWEWTESERSDGRTRFCILHGGSFYRARGSQWYADGGPQPCGFVAKFLLSWPGLDRCATIGFRCAADLPGPNAA